MIIDEIPKKYLFEKVSIFTIEKKMLVFHTNRMNGNLESFIFPSINKFYREYQVDTWRLLSSQLKISQPYSTYSHYLCNFFYLNLD